MTNGKVDASLDSKAKEYTELEKQLHGFIDILESEGLLGSVFAVRIRRKAR